MLWENTIWWRVLVHAYFILKIDTKSLVPLFIYDNTKKNTKCLEYLKNLRDKYFCVMGLHCRIYKNHQHKMIRHTKLIDHILRLPSLDATL